MQQVENRHGERATKATSYRCGILIILHVIRPSRLSSVSLYVVDFVA